MFTVLERGLLRRGARCSLQDLIYDKVLLLADGKTGLYHDHISLHTLLTFIMCKEHLTMLKVLQKFIISPFRTLSLDTAHLENMRM